MAGNDGNDRFGTRIPPDRFSDDPPARAMVVTCLDGCMPAGCLEEQFDPAGLIVVRTAANLVPPFGSADAMEQAIEHAVSVRGVRDVVVCGHGGCATLSRLFDPRLALGDLSLAAWLEHAEAVRRAALSLSPAERLARAAELNVQQQLAHLRSHPAVAAGLLAGGLRLFGWLLDPALGVTFAADAQTGRFTRRAALDPMQNHLFRKERLRAKPPAPLPVRDLRSRYLA